MQTAPGSPVSPKEGAPEDIDATEGGSSTTEAQPGLIQRRNTFRIEKVGEFRREDGQPLFLNAYPPVTRPTGLKVDDPDQAYRAQDLVDPAVIRPRHTRRERLRCQEEDQRKKQAGKVLPIPVASPETTERTWYSGSQVIETRSQPWPKHLDGSSDPNTLAMCDHHVTDAVKQEPLLGKLRQTSARLTLTYLTIVTPIDDVILSAKEAIEISAAQPYARGRHHEPIGERVIVNDLYGIPLYKPAVGPIDPDLGTGAIAAERIIAETGADPNFVSDQVQRNPSTGTYAMMFQDRDSGPMWYTCRMDDCCTVGGITLAFSTEEELVAHWNTFHVAVAPQFTCQVPGCHLTFAADPGALDRYLAHIGQKMTEEKGSRKSKGKLHSLDGALPGALSVKPNPFFKPPSSVHGVPRRQAEVMAPPKYRASTGSRLGVLNIRWSYRKIFQTKLLEPLAQHQKSIERKRACRDSLSERTPKRAKLDLEHRRRSNPSEDGRSSTSSKSSKRSGASKTKKTLKVKLGKRCQTVVSQKAPSPRKAGRHCRESTSSSATSDRSGRRANLASQGEVRITVPNEQDSMRAGPTEQRLAWEEPDPLVRSEPTRCARDAAAWAEVCPATDFETGQLIGRVGTPEDPLFTYEQAVHHRRGRENLLLVVGAAIPTKERDRLSEATISELSKRQTDVEAHRLPTLPRGVVPRGWNGWGRPWALIDCPADKVPQVASNQGCERVTVAALVDFLPEPFYVPSATSLDYALRYQSKASKKGTLTWCLTLEQDEQWKDPAGTYKRLKLPTYHHSIPVQELLRSHRWTAFQEGRWGNRPNPPIPEGDVRPSGGAASGPSGSGAGIKLAPVRTPESLIPQRSASPAMSPAQQPIVPSFDREEADEEEMELTVPASPPMIAAPRQVPSSAKVAETVTNIW